MIILGISFSLWALPIPASDSTRTIPIQQEFDGFIVIEGNSLVGRYPTSSFEEKWLREAISGQKWAYLELVREKYPEMADLLLCIWEKESSYGKKIYGDYRNGEPKAFGHFQIWISKHNISYECALDFSCSLDWTAQKIKEGKGYLWSSYPKCQKLLTLDN